MSFFDRPDDYSKILNRMTWINWFIAIVSSAFFIQALSDNGVFFPTPKALADLEIEYLGFNGSLYIVAPAFIIALIFRRVRMHERISDLLKIREAFDTHVILSRLAGEVGIPVDLNVIKKFRNERQNLMNKVFYPYVDATNPKISKHHVLEALDAWFGYWIAIEATVILIPFGICFIFFDEAFLSAIFLAFALLCTFIGMRYFRKCAPMAENEISAMTTHEDWDKWKESIKNHFDNALQG